MFGAIDLAVLETFSKSVHQHACLRIRVGDGSTVLGLTRPIGGCFRGLATLLKDIPVNNEKKFAFVAVHEGVSRLRIGHCR